jgi:hypothetical protein
MTSVEAKKPPCVPHFDQLIVPYVCQVSKMINIHG